VKRTILTVAALGLGLAAAPRADAACFDRPGTPKAMRLPAGRIAPGYLGAGGPAADWGTGNASIVGLWLSTYFVGDGPTLWDQGFQQWHSDGTELAVDNAVPPPLGNVCVGVYVQTGPRTYKLRHVTWNWDPSGSLAGTFLLQATVTVGPRGNRYSGTYVSDSFDLNGQTIPELHGEGIVRGERITVE
jgi:hypothetical protein